MPGSVFQWLAAIALVAGWLFLGFGLFGDTIRQRFRKRRRCPRCWYDMSRTEGLTCSECGKVAKRDRHLLKGRKRWSLVLFAFVFWVGSYAAYVTPNVQDRGWVAVVPTVAIIAAMPWLDLSESLLASQEMSLSDRKKFERSLLVDLRDHRVKNHDINWWQERLLIERCLRGDDERRPLNYGWDQLYGQILHRLDPRRQQSEDREQAIDEASWWLDRANRLVDLKISTRPIWPKDLPVYARISLQRWDHNHAHRVIADPLDSGFNSFKRVESAGFSHYSYGDCWDHDDILGIGRGGIQQVQYRIQAWQYPADAREKPLDDADGFLLYDHHVDLPISFCDSIDDVLQPVESAEIDALMASLKPTIGGLGSSNLSRFSLNLFPDRRQLVRERKLDVLRDVTLAVTIDIRWEGTSVASAPLWFWVYSSSRAEPCWCVYSSDPGCRFTNAIRAVDMTDKRLSDNWTIVLRSDPVTALRNFRCDRYWKGEIELPLTVGTRD